MDRPILFSAPMVRAILAERKTQTRRIVDPSRVGAAFQPVHDWQSRVRVDPGGTVFGPGPYLRVPMNDGEPEGEVIERVYCPYGYPGDRLWVREVHYRFGHWEPVSGPRERTRTGRQRWQFVGDSDEVRFEPPTEHRLGMHHADPFTPAWHKRLARFMPRAASRITLAITEVRAERLQDITEEDARAEGVVASSVGGDLNHRGQFRKLWDSINAARAPWSENPWVWVVSFRRVDPAAEGVDRG